MIKHCRPHRFQDGGFGFFDSENFFFTNAVKTGCNTAIVE
jgi:hypothetical protein